MSNSKGSKIAAGEGRPLPDQCDQFRYFFCLAVPLTWSVAAFVSWRHPGDEFLLFQLVNGLPGAWIPLLFGPIRGPEMVPTMLASGLFTVAAFGWLMDRLQVGRRLWLLLFATGVPALFFLGLSQYPSIERAIAKNGSIATYLAAATNLSVYLASALAILVTLIRRVVEFSRAKQQPRR